MNDVMRKEYQALSPEQTIAIGHIKDMAENLHNYLSNIAHSREISLAKTKLEEVVMWATKGIALS